MNHLLVLYKNICCDIFITCEFFIYFGIYIYQNMLHYQNSYIRLSNKFLLAFFIISFITISCRNTITFGFVVIIFLYLNLVKRCSGIKTLACSNSSFILFYYSSSRYFSFHSFTFLIDFLIN